MANPKTYPKKDRSHLFYVDDNGNMRFFILSKYLYKEIIPLLFHYYFTIKKLNTKNYGADLQPRSFIL